MVGCIYHTESFATFPLCLLPHVRFAFRNVVWIIPDPFLYVSTFICLSLYIHEMCRPMQIMYHVTIPTFHKNCHSKLLITPENIFLYFKKFKRFPFWHIYGRWRFSNVKRKGKKINEGCRLIGFARIEFRIVRIDSTIWHW